MNTIRLGKMLSLFASSISPTSRYIYTHEGFSANIIFRSYYTLYQLGSKQPIHHHGDDISLLKKAFRLVLKVSQASQASQESSPQTLTPSFLQTITLSLIIAEKLNLGIKAIICGLLYSIVKEKKVLLCTLKKEFSDDIIDVIQGLIFISDHTSTGCDKHARALQYIYTTFSHNHLLIILLNFAEYMQKIYVIEVWNEEKQIALVQQMEGWYGSLVKILGFDNLYLELTDICFKLKNRTAYNQLISLIQNSLKSQNGFLEHFSQQIYTMIQKANICCSIRGRTKSIASIYNKIQNRGIAFEDINDFYAICIVLESTLEDEFNTCWYVYNMIAERYRLRMKYLRDWISRSKSESSSYEALHITIQSDEGPWVEVQIRTQRMDDNAEYGDAAHWKYKNNHEMITTAWSNISWLAQARDYLQRDKPRHKEGCISIIASEIYIT